MRSRLNPLYTVFFAAVVLTACRNAVKPAVSAGAVLFQDVTLIDGNGAAPLEHTDILIQGDTIASIGKGLDTAGVKVLKLSGKTIMPALISSHVHVGTLKGTTTKSVNYTRENILVQLKKYQDYGIENIQVMGTDRPMLFTSGLRDSSVNSLLPGARLYSAGYGFGVPQNAPPVDFGMDRVYRPLSAAEIPAKMDSLAKLKPSVVKMWVDDFGGKFKKMDPSIYRAIITEAHKHHIRVATHLYYLSDARKLVADGVNIIGHSIRDSVADDQLINEMKAKGVAYIPTLSLDEFAYIYARKPEWIDDEFFKSSLEPGVYEMITSKKYQDALKKAPGYARSVAAYETALRNLKKLYVAGILVAMGTDSGATPVRAQGFSEHLELELMVQAGLTPLQAIGVATKNSAKILQIADRFGTLEKGKIADLIVLKNNPATDIKNTRSIEAVYKAGKEVSKGPLNK
ncbi:amidohydrolase family protein [Pedobacter hartonius]|uniref:Imidazolonepropionase n=1 Tax=Pedobacter hartonius TaxID=425514 RepID=A0A1H4GJA4_9SPHI|nr:amidohydrolase family protein [Pedobacter hartonius]SEB09686.1 Imidazolonepropionase [Pedobacter hartonius]